MSTEIELLKVVKNSSYRKERGSVSKEWTRAKTIDELFNFFRKKDRIVDPRTGHERSKYELQGEFILYRINLYKPAPSLVLYENDLDQDLKAELDDLDDATLNDVMVEAIYRLLDELNTSTFRVDVLRRRIRWEVQ